MSWRRIRRRPADIQFSRYIRRVRPYCQRCGKNSQDASHFWSRIYESVRFDEENVDALCKGCHEYFTVRWQEYQHWKLKQLGRQRYAYLEIRAYLPGKRDDNIILIWLKGANDELDKEMEEKA